MDNLDNNPNSPQEFSPPPKTSSKKKLIIAVVALMVLTLIGVGVFYITTQTNSSGNNFDITEEEQDQYLASQKQYMECSAAARERHFASIEEECLKLTGNKQCGLPNDVRTQLEAILQQAYEDCKVGRIDITDFLPPEEAQNVEEARQKGVDRAHCNSEAFEKYMSSVDTFCRNQIKENTNSYEECLNSTGFNEFGFISESDCKAAWKPEEFKQEFPSLRLDCNLPSELETELDTTLQKDKVECSAKFPPVDL